ncbi:MAG TPA: TldD/PmbA family protein [Chloroflexota bacterium]|nr:TldD/PmbA family protein [Chloroflexota bacterium]
MVAAQPLASIAAQLLDLTKGRVEQAEVYAYETAETPVDFEANRLKALETKESRGLALRVIKDGRIGLASSTRLDDLGALVETAVELAPFGAEAKFELPASVTPTAVEVFNPQTELIGVERMADLGQEMIDRVLAYDPAILCEAGVRRQVHTIEILNSRGAQGSYRKSSYALIIGGQLIRGEDFLSIWEFEASCAPQLDHRALADAAIRKFDLAKNVETVSTRRMPVVFNPRGVAYILLRYLDVALSGKAVLQGASALSDKLGQPVFDPRLTVVDDSTISGVPGAAPFDDEGVPTRRLPLIDHGVVTNFYYDLQTAGLAGTASTGNGYRSPASLPSPSTGVLVVEPGDQSLDSLLAGIEEGVLVESTTGSAGNVYSGDFSGNIQTGFKIERGKLTGRVKNTMVSGNVFSDMKQLGGISDVAEWVGGSVKAPHLAFTELGVSTKSS